MKHALTPTSMPNPFLAYDDSSQIPGWQRRLHFGTEVIALLMIPRLFAAAKSAKQPHKRFLLGVAWGTLLVDGYLVYRWLTEASIQSERQLAQQAANVAAAQGDQNVQVRIR